MSIDFKEYVLGRLQREDDRELFSDLWETFLGNGPEEVTKSVLELISSLEEG